MAAALLLLVACNPDPVKRQISFVATTEQWNSNDAKVRLDDNEQWIYWELDDVISIGSDNTGNTEGWLMPGGGGDWGEYSSVFLAEMNEGSKYFLGLHPYSEKNVISYSGGANHHFNQPTIFLNNVQTYRTDDKGDHTFDRQVLPMVAWSGHEWNSTGIEPKLDFHTLAGLVRLQFFNQTGSAQAIKNVTITALTPDGGHVQDKQVANTNICGLFKVKGQHGANPSLTFVSKDDLPSSNTVTIKRSDDGNIDFPVNDLKSFYVVLPALCGQDSSTVYKLQVAVTNADNKVFKKTVSVVRTRRRGITYMQAMGISAFNETSGTGSAGLSGNGTEERPFKIYTVDDLHYLRDQLNNGRPINGTTVTASTVFHVMNNIELTTANWNIDGINFTGIMRFRGNSKTPGITNNSNKPLFNSIGSGSRVEGLTVRYNHSGSLAVTASGDFSPFAVTNAGTISDCHVTTVAGSGSVNISSGGSTMRFGGICATNSGLVENCESTLQAEFNANVTYGGIVHTNTGTVQGCHTSTPLSIQGPGSAGGIVHTNNGTVKDCYYAAQLSDVNCPWGGIVYTLAGGTVEHCYAARSATLGKSSSGTVRIGGIVNNTNTSSNNKIDYCWCGSNLQGTDVGGIVYWLAGGTLINCFVDDSSLIVHVNTSASPHRVGGLVGYMSAGTVSNSYVVMSHVEMPVGETTDTTGVLIGSIWSGTVSNCYSLMAHGTRKFYGKKVDAGSPTLSNNYQVGGTAPDEITSVARNSEGAVLKNNLQNYDSKVSGSKDWLYDETGLSAAAQQALVPWLQKYTLDEATAKAKSRRRK